MFKVLLLLRNLKHYVASFCTFYRKVINQLIFLQLTRELRQLFTYSTCLATCQFTVGWQWIVFNDKVIENYNKKMFVRILN